MNPLISIVVPIYNVELYIEECLDSLLSQNIDRIQIICVDDGSTDNSYNIALSYSKRDSRIEVYHKENGGLSSARNYGIDKAKGKYICFVDSDDMLMESALCKIIAKVNLDDSPQIISYETAPLLYESGVQRDLKKEEYYRVKNEYCKELSGCEFLCEAIENDDFVDSACLELFDRTWLIQNGIRFQEGALFEDSIFYIECLLNAKKTLHFDDKIYVYRVRNGSIMMRGYTYDYVRWRLWQQKECLRFLFTYAQNDRVKKAILKYMIPSAMDLHRQYELLSSADKERLTDLLGEEGLLLKYMDVGIARLHNDQLKIQGLIGSIQRAGSIVLYGAGTIGNKVVSLCKRINCLDKVKGIGISDKYETDMAGMKIKHIGDYDVVHTDLLIISAGNKFHDEMYRTAKNIGYSNILFITYDIEASIDNFLRNCEENSEN